MLAHVFPLTCNELVSTGSSPPPISVKLPTDGRFVNLDRLDNLFLIAACFQQDLNLVSLFTGELRVSHQCSFDLVGQRDADLNAAHLLFQMDKVALMS